MSSPTRFNQAKIPVSSGTNPVSYNSGRMSAGVGYVVLGRGVNRADYISNCHRNNTITVRSDSGEIIRNISVSTGLWNTIHFPVSYRDQGSMIVWVNVPVLNRVIAVASLPKKDEFNDANAENSVYVGHRTNTSAAQIQMNGERGSVNIVSRALSEGGAVNIIVHNSDEVGQFKVYVQGDIDMQAERTCAIKVRTKFALDIADVELDDQVTNFSIIKGEGVMLKDEFGNVFYTDETGFGIRDSNKNMVSATKDGIDIESKGHKTEFTSAGIKNTVSAGKKIRLVDEKLEKDEDIAALCGPLIKSLDAILDTMNEFINNISTATVTAPTGALPMTPITITAFQNMLPSIIKQKSQLQLIKSKTVKLT